MKDINRQLLLFSTGMILWSWLLFFIRNDGIGAVIFGNLIAVVGIIVSLINELKEEIK